MDELYLKDRFENRNILYLFNKDITEYDIKSANTSISREFGLLPESKIKWLEGMDRGRRHTTVGTLQGSDKVFNEGLKNGFATCRKYFIEANDLERDDIISIRKDAIWTTRSCRFTEFGKNIKFKEKQKFTSFIRLDKHTEIFYNPGKIRVSGIDDNVVKKHENFMLDFISKWFHKMETEHPEEVIRYTRKFIDRYKRRELGVNYYRRFDRDAMIYLNDGTRYEEYWDEKVCDVEILYNLYNVLIKLVKIPL